MTIAAPQPAQNVPPARSSWPQVEQTALIYRKAYLGSEQGPEGALAYFVAHCALRRRADPRSAWSCASPSSRCSPRPQLAIRELDPTAVVDSVAS